jgi:prolyl-tRNA editing enzyme YbaK/EbsC (Cys-tRNA(Pro) deacylase)
MQPNDPVANVKKFLHAAGCDAQITHSDESIFTVEDASRAVGAPPEKILKSLLFIATYPDGDERWTLALMSGSNRVSDKKVKRAIGAQKIKMAPADAIAAYSGFAPGGVPPVGYPQQPQTLIDEDLFMYDAAWAAAGTDHDFFPISPQELQSVTGGGVADIKKD